MLLFLFHVNVIAEDSKWSYFITNQGYFYFSRKNYDKLILRHVFFAQVLFENDGSVQWRSWLVAYFLSGSPLCLCSRSLGLRVPPPIAQRSAQSLLACSFNCCTVLCIHVHTGQETERPWGQGSPPHPRACSNGYQWTNEWPWEQFVSCQSYASENEYYYFSPCSLSNCCLLLIAITSEFLKNVITVHGVFIMQKSIYELITFLRNRMKKIRISCRFTYSWLADRKSVV